MVATPHAGTPLPELTLEITQERLDAYCEASGDHNPLHWDAQFAAATQFGGIIAHGMLTLALVSRMMAAAYGKAWLESGGLRTRFKGAAYLGDTVVSRGRVTKDEDRNGQRVVTCAVAVVNKDTDEELVTGTATVKLE
jgi:3-hydroxybutyryl-CoA dehydratase